jgi:Uma2 family endonuclease
VRDHERCSEAEYIARERTAETKSEYVNGYVVAMAGASIRHNLIASNIVRHLGNRIAGKCLVLASDQRVWVSETDDHFYPDISVVCGRVETHPRDDQAIMNPKLIVEVLSDSTEDYDRGTKFLHYRKNAALQDYILVSQHDRSVEHFRRVEGEWVLREIRGDQELVLASVGVRLPLDDIYDNVDQLTR